MSGSRHQDLLFATIALQRNAVSREQLQKAVDAWTDLPQKSLEDILLEHGSLDEGNCRAIRSLVDAIRTSGDDHDMTRTLSPTNATDELRAILERLSDGEATEQAEHVPPRNDTVQDHRSKTDGSVHRASTLSRAGTECRYEKLQFHNEGGLGMVFVALDKELGRRVALKELQPKVADDELSQLRFITEAEITGGLGHPGIVSVYGLGRYPDGRPYYAMQFIQGNDLRTKIAEHYERATRDTEAQNRVELRRLLGHFIDACHAVHYAHTRGVLHRDIKPGNIMIGKYGETLVVDWGLAKWQDNAPSAAMDDAIVMDDQLVPLSGSQVAATMLGSAVGTPFYMSPEQARGDHGNVGPATDIYSLGGTLFVLLTNHRPREEQPDVIRAARLGTVTNPRSVDPRIPKPLASICLRAMAAEPDDRYPTALALADDLEQFLADEQVAAHKETLLETSQRFIRRHRELATTAALGLVVVGIISVFWGVYSHRLKNKAHAAEQRSEASLDFLVNSFRSPDPKIQGREVRVASILDQAFEESEGQYDDETRAEILEAIARTYKGLRMPKEAIRVSQELLSLRNKLHGPEHPATLFSRHFLGAALVDDDQLEEAESGLEKTLRQRKRVLGAKHPETLKTANILASVRFQLGEREQAIAELREVVDLERVVWRDQPEKTVPAIANLARMYIQNDATDLGLQLYERAYRIRRECFGDSHADTLMSMKNLAAAYCDNDRPEESIKLYDTNNLLKKLQEAFGETSLIYLEALRNRAIAIDSLGNRDEAIATLEKAVDGMQSSPQVGETHRATIDAMESLAAMYVKTHRPALAKPVAVAVLERRLALLEPNHHSVLTSIEGLIHCANAFIHNGEFAEAESLCRRLLDQLRGLRWELHDLVSAHIKVVLAAALLEQDEAEEALRVAAAALPYLCEPAVDNSDQQLAYARLRNIRGAALHATSQDGAEPLLVESGNQCLALWPHVEQTEYWIIQRGLQRIINFYDANENEPASQQWREAMAKVTSAWQESPE